MPACRSCGAEIVWALTDKGKRMPLDALAERRFVLKTVGGQLTCLSEPVYTSHFVTCPDADQHRKGD